MTPSPNVRDTARHRNVRGVNRHPENRPLVVVHGSASVDETLDVAVFSDVDFGATGIATRWGGETKPHTWTHARVRARTPTTSRTRTSIAPDA